MNSFYFFNTKHSYKNIFHTILIKNDGIKEITENNAFYVPKIQITKYIQNIMIRAKLVNFLCFVIIYMNLFCNRVSWLDVRMHSSKLLRPERPIFGDMMTMRRASRRFLACRNKRWWRVTLQWAERWGDVAAIGDHRLVWAQLYPHSKIQHCHTPET